MEKTMTAIIRKQVRSEPERAYFEIGDFEIRTGKFNDGGLYSNEKWEIRILSKDMELMEALADKLKEMLSE